MSMKSLKRDEIAPAIRQGAIHIMETWCRGELTGAARAIETHRRLLDRMEEMLKQDLWKAASRVEDEV